MRRLLTPLGVSLLALFALVFVLASAIVVVAVRYGGPEELYYRVRQKLAVREAHPDFVPTPLSAAASVEGERPTLLPNELFENPGPALSDPGEFALTTQPGALPERQAAGGGSAEPAVAQPGAVLVAPTITGHQSEVATLPEPSRSGLAAPAAAIEAATPDAPLPTARAEPDPVTLPTAEPTPAYRPASASAEIAGIRHAWQTWNNCGPATLSMHLSYFGSKLTQADIGKVLKGNRDDKNVSPEELAGYAESQGLHALVRRNGSLAEMRLLLTNGLPVLIETWLEDEPNNGMGHYRLLTAFDDAKDEWRAFDSYVSKGLDAGAYRGIRFTTAELDDLWRVFNRTYIVIYSDEYGPVVRSILGRDYEERAMWQRALADAQALVAAQPHDAFAWFNLGSNLTALGRYEEAVAAFDQARVIKLPWRMLWYQFAPFRAYYETGQYQELLALVDATIRTKGNIEEVYYWKGMALEAQGDVKGARQAWQKAVELNPRYPDALAALQR